MDTLTENFQVNLKINTNQIDSLIISRIIPALRKIGFVSYEERGKNTFSDIPFIIKKENEKDLLIVIEKEDFPEHYDYFNFHLMENILQYKIGVALEINENKDQAKIIISPSRWLL